MNETLKSVDLFAGAGGLALGISKAGFEHEVLIDWDKHACRTLVENKRRNTPFVGNWNICECDVRDFDYSQLSDDIALLAGGPPCQPFSIGGKHKGHKDRRDMFPEAVRAVRHLHPKAFIFENVKGLQRKSFARYFEYIQLQLSYPEIKPRRKDTWLDHLSRLEKQHTKGLCKGLFYRVVWRLLNAADYGVPQRRERVFIVGFRSDLNIQWSFPKPTHSRGSLLKEKWVTGEYWRKHRIPRKDRPEPPPYLEGNTDSPVSTPWKTVRDAVCDLPDPEKLRPNNHFSNHDFVPGARVYKGHTGSPLDEPAKTLKAGDHGVPGGENMMIKPNGDVRYFTVREAARIQSFPDDFYFTGSWTENMRQLGNAVPVLLSEIISSNIRIHLLENMNG